MHVKNFMIPAKQVITASPSSSLTEVGSLMVTNHIGCVLIVENSKPIGIITKSDMVKYYLENADIKKPVQEFMSTNLKTVKDTLETDQAATEMNSSKLHYLIVNDSKNNWEGIVSTKDVLEEEVFESKAFPYVTRVGISRSSPYIKY
ncbi:predicted protein [Naegleria gruberi]|uniref:Predicted protein n=1 Tax=Naegleria gruberi TaxID=5762 RepID=D2VL30_NAEGR|nr:uncharacterized protein NAEGRDRAFT_50449 [Naegleria gruberi]EFC42466.1 predicted protein [Naegleria gruberi]|eukprot:XP_002675210.1 predicted protein [Naegleria gruberi strain NEG-M]